MSPSPPRISNNPDRHVGRYSPEHDRNICYECSLFGCDSEDVIVLWPCSVNREARRRRQVVRGRQATAEV